jgi:hypothetical protein
LGCRVGKLANGGVAWVLVSGWLLLLAGCGGGGGGGGGGTITYDRGTGWTGTGDGTLFGTVMTTILTKTLPVGGAIVRAGGGGWVTANSGAFTVNGVVTSATSGTVTTSGYQTLTFNFAFPDGVSTPAVNVGTVTIVQTTPAATCTVTGQCVWNDASGDPVSGVTVSIGGRTAVTGGDGRFTISQVPINETSGSVTAKSGSWYGTAFSADATSPYLCQWKFALAGGTNNIGKVFIISTNLPPPPPPF